MTIRAASEQSLDLALLFIFRKVQSCRREALNSRTLRSGHPGGVGSRPGALIYTVMRVPKVSGLSPCVEFVVIGPESSID